MSVRKTWQAAAAASLTAAILFLLPPIVGDAQVYGNLPIRVKLAGSSGQLQLYWSEGGAWTEGASQRKPLRSGENALTFFLPRASTRVRIDFEGDQSEAAWTLTSLTLDAAGASADLLDAFAEAEAQDLRLQPSGDDVRVDAVGGDPHVALSVADAMRALQLPIAARTRLLDGMAKVGVGIAIGLLVLLGPALCEWIALLWKSRKLIFDLAKNDFKGRFAGSTLGVVWAFVQPVITIAVYCFVFQFGFRAQPVSNGFPYVLWLVAGMVPWLFFGEGWSGGGNALLEYKYLVQKMVFPIATLPAVKVFASLMLHAIFLGLTAVLFACFGVMPSMRWLELLYYLVCLVALLLGLAALSAAMTPLWRDAGQVIAILTQLGFWITPIAWELESTVRSPALRLWFRANPMHYVVTGYRDSLLGGAFFFQRPESVYFWCVTSIAIAGGAWVFRRLKPHFADVL